MPQIPEVVATPQVPQRTGVPQSTTGAPAPARVAAPAGAAGILGEAIAGIGGEVVRFAEVERRRQGAQDVLDSAQQTQEFTLQAQERFADLAQNGDFRTLPEDMERTGRELIATMRQGLNAGAGQRFEVQALDVLNNLQAKALGVRTARREEQKQFVVAQQVQQFGDAIANAGNAADRDLARANMETLLQDMVDSGLMRGAEAATILRKATDNATALSVRNQMRRVPQATAIALERRIEAGQQQLGGVPLSTLLDEARGLARQRRVDQINDERRDAVLLDKEQDERAVALRAEIVVLDPVPENTQAFRGLLQTVNRLGVDDLGVEHHARLTTMLRGMLNASLSPGAAQDDPVTLRDLTMLVETARTPEEARDAQIDLLQHASRLTPGTFTRLNARAEARQQSTHYTHRPLYRRGRELITRAFFPVETAIVDPKALSSDEQQQLLFALDEFDDAMARANEAGAQEVDRQALDAAGRIRRKMFISQELPGGTTRLGVPPQLDPARGGPRDADSARRAIAKMAQERALTMDQQMQLFARWQELLRFTTELEQLQQQKEP